MKHLRDTIKIAIADSSLMMRLGISAAIKRASDTDVQFVEIENLNEINNKIDTFKPHILIVSSTFGFQMQISDLRNYPDLKKVLLISSLIDPKMVNHYDATINIYDSAEHIHSVIDSLMNYDEEETEVDNEEQLSQREKEIICEVVKGKTNKEIADHLSLSVFTILTHRRNIAKKLQIHSSTALAIYAIANKLVSISEVK